MFISALHRQGHRKNLARLITIISYLEKGIFEVTGTKRRKRGHYCNVIRRYGNNKEAKNMMNANRYHFLTIKILTINSKNTVEFRAFSGTLNEVKIVGWIQLCIAIVEKALDTKRLPKWNLKQPLCCFSEGFWARGGNGETEMNRMLSRIAHKSFCYCPEMTTILYIKYRGADNNF